MRFLGPPALSLLAACAVSTTAPAQEAGKAADGQPTPAAAASPQPGAEERKSDFTVSLLPLGEVTFRSDLRDGPGDVSVYRAGLGTSLTVALGDRARFTLNMDNEASWYQFDNASGLIAGAAKPFNDVYRVNARPMVFVSENRRFHWYVGGIVEVAGEAGVDIGDAITGGGFGGVRYYFSEDFAVSVGVAARTRLGESMLVIPLIGLDWTINDHTRLSVDGLTARLTTDLRKDLEFFIAGGWELRDYRFENDSPLPGGAVHDIRVPVGAGFKWSPCKTVSVELSGGAVVWQRFRFDDSNSNRVAEEHTDPAPFVKLTATITF